jgi:hypothetical protein
VRYQNSRAMIWQCRNYCHMFQRRRRGFGLVNRFIGSWLVITTISSYTLKITLTTEHVTSHTKSSNSSSELKWSEVPFPSSLTSSRHGPRTENTILLLCSATTQKTNHVITISPVHWRADCCLPTSYKHSSYCCVRVSRGVYRAVAWQCVDMSQYFPSASLRYLLLKAEDEIDAKCASGLDATLSSGCKTDAKRSN